ncbi:TauD/TfdA dioxygenase family protein [Candidimonas nitroreducens]|nr:TauD/TfdA family dioxygenase [Candidimonas nitroreducens]
MPIELRTLAEHVGAEVLGIDLSKTLEPRQAEELNDAFNTHGVLLFRKQSLTPEQHIGFSRNFGSLEVHVLRQYLLTNHPEILVISNVLEDGKQIGINDAGQYWHTDLSYKEVPSKGSVLYAKRIPFSGNDKTYGDTCYVSTAAAYDALLPNEQAQLAGLKAMHRYEARYERLRQQNESRQQLTEKQKQEVPPVVHPVIRTHPYTGRRCLYVNEGFTTGIAGMSLEDSNRLLQKLFNHCTQEKFMYRHKWQVGDVLMWDNCSTQHFAIADYGIDQPRLMHRTTITGTAVQ